MISGSELSRSKIETVNEDSFLLILGTEIDIELTPKIAALDLQIKKTLSHHLLDSTPSYTTILVQFNLLTTHTVIVYEQLRTLLFSSLPVAPHQIKKHHRLPVYYHESVAPDLRALAESKGLTPLEVATLHTQRVYQVCALGFSPGFAFLAEVDECIRQKRLATPRPKVKAGSVAIADSQTAIYPSDTPGGWNVIGHCPVRIFDMHASPISDFTVGDSITFYAVDEKTYLTLLALESEKKTSQVRGREMQGLGDARQQAVTKDRRALAVIKAGVLSLIQDQGRFGHSGQGVSQGGSIDATSAAWANYLLGNRSACAVIEVTIGGAELMAMDDLDLALTGAEMDATIFDGAHQVVQKVTQQCFRLHAGQRLTLGFASVGVRAYLAVKGGFKVRSALGSCSTVIRNQIGGLTGRGHPVAKDDLILAKGDIAYPANTEFINKRVPARYRIKQPHVTKIGVIECYQHTLFSAQQKRQFYQQIYCISPHSDRMGMRLSGEALHINASGIISEGIALGSIQFPPNGIPIILLQDRQTLGGYPKIGCVHRLDIGRLAQLPAGRKIQFYPMSLQDAQTQYRQQLAFFNRID